MKFDEEHKVIIHTMSKEQAEVFIVFLETEIKRHEEDIVFTKARITDTKQWHGIE